MKKMLSVTGIGFLFLAGLVLLMYPTVSDWLAKQYHVTEIKNYDEIITSMTAQKMQEETQKAKEYDDTLSGNEIKDPFIPCSGVVLPENYTSVLNLPGGVIGYIEVPYINVSLPIYHGVDKKVLEKGVGHMEMTAFPVGGEGNHAVLTGHTGLPSAKLFTDLDKLKVRDIFYIHILDETLEYEIDQILVVDPSVTEDLRPVKGEDYVTLITCTPYSVNSHRLLVRGKRVPDVVTGTESEVNTAEAEVNTVVIDFNRLIWIIIEIAVFLFTCRFLNRYCKK